MHSGRQNEFTVRHIRIVFAPSPPFPSFPSSSSYFALCWRTAHVSRTAHIRRRAWGFHWTKTIVSGEKTKSPNRVQTMAMDTFVFFGGVRPEFWVLNGKSLVSRTEDMWSSTLRMKRVVPKCTRLENSGCFRIVRRCYCEKRIIAITVEPQLRRGFTVNDFRRIFRLHVACSKK